MPRPVAPPPSPPSLQDRFRGAVLGLAIGDALGFPLRDIPPASLRRLPHLADDFAPRPRGRFARGQFSDDTQLMLATAESISREGRIDGRSLGAHYAWMWKEGVVLQPPRALGSALERLAEGTPWMSAGASLGMKDPSCLSRALVVGLWLSSDVSRLPHDAGVAAVVTHKDPECQAAAAAYARAVALSTWGALPGPKAFCDALAQSAAVHSAGLALELTHLPGLLAFGDEEALATLRRIGVPRRMLDQTDGIPAHVTPVLLISLFCALRSPGDFRGALRRVLSLGGEVDVATALCGGLLGTQLGMMALPARLREKVLYPAELQAAADKLLEARRSYPGAIPATVRGKLQRG